VPFLGMEAIESAKQADGDERNSYDIVANIKMTFALEAKALGDYRRDVEGIKSFDEFILLLETYIECYSWTFTNGASDTEADRKDATGIFDVRFIEAERTSENVYKETKKEIDAFTKDQNNSLAIQQLKQGLATELEKLLDPALKKMSQLFDNENNEIGLRSGNVSIFQNMRPDIRISDAYVTDVKDTKGGFVVPLANNGLGYNNLINIYMLIKLTEVARGRDFRILCLEEPEAHLHPAMQYKLFKFLKTLDETNKLNQQIFVTTHSSNISAVAGIDNMYMLDYCRTTPIDCCQQSLEVHFANKADAKKHLTKFLDVTRSDMLFADKVILVEGLAEKLLLPVFMEKCGCSYEDCHVSIVEIGGKHFEHFIELFNGNAIKKKVLCITDRDFKWIKEEDSVRMLANFEEYRTSETSHITALKEKFPIDNLCIVTQTAGGKTFEDELFSTCLSDDATSAKKLMRLIANDTVMSLIDNYGLDFDEWDRNRPPAVNSIVSRYLDIFKAAITRDNGNSEAYKRLFFCNAVFILFP